MQATTSNIDQMITKMQAWIDELSADALVRTNDGTFGPHECLKAVGTGDGKAGTRKVFERLDGSRYARGPEEERCPGRMRDISGPTANQRRAEIAKLTDAIERLRGPGISVRIPDDIVDMCDRLN